MASINVPKRHRAVVAELTRLDVEQMGDIVSDLDTHWAGGEPFGAVRQVSDGEACREALVGMTAARLAHDISPDDLVEMVRDDLGAEAGTTSFAALVGHPVIVRAAKRLDLRTSFPNTMVGFRLLTDVRPVFDEEVEAGVAAAFATQTLQLTFTQENDVRELYISVDEDDLNLIKAQVDRALSKARAAERFIAQAKVQVLRDKEET